jgi:ABC-type methionine transport system ATPase subunit
VFSNHDDQEAMMTNQVVRLIYPEHLLSVPIINQLIRRYDLTVNILRAKIGGEDRWLEVQLAGNPTIIDEAISWLENQGITVQYQ